MYLRDCYYVAGWTKDFPAEGIVSVMLLNEPIILYRTAEGVLTALEDRCCHRAAPLSKGRLEGDDVRCMYHGIKFGPDGCCTELPGQDVIPKAVRVRSYPVVEKYGAAWVWMGDPARADEGVIPDFIGPDDGDWALSHSFLDIDAEAQLLIDNLLDVSHAPYVHEATFAAGSKHNVSQMIKAENEAKTTRLERGVRVERWIVGRDDNRFLGGITTDDFAFNEVNVPGVFTMWTRCYPEGTFARIGEVTTPDETPLLARFVGQIITPIADGKCRLYFAAGPWQAQASMKDEFFKIVNVAFREDEDIKIGRAHV